MKRESAKVSQTTAILVEINENNVVEVTAEERGKKEELALNFGATRCKREAKRGTSIYFIL